jgi:hypothetical protein
MKLKCCIVRSFLQIYHHVLCMIHIFIKFYISYFPVRVLSVNRSSLIHCLLYSCPLSGGKRTPMTDYILFSSCCNSLLCHKWQKTVKTIMHFF